MASIGFISVIVPVYNEEKFLRPAVAEILRQLETLAGPFEVILVENGSTDATHAISKDLAQSDHRLRLIHMRDADYGRALRTGFLAGKGACLANFSIDFADVDFLRIAIAKLGEYDLILGSKYVVGGRDRRPFARRLAGIFLSGIARRLFDLPYSDTHGLLVLRQASAAPLIAGCCFGNEVFDTELIVRAHRAGLEILELPIQVEERRPSRTGSVRRAGRMLVQLARLRAALRRERVGR